jgi:hypothetical protein
MRMLFKVAIPVTSGNSATQDGSLPQVVQAFLETRRPEAAYFLTEDGRRTMYAVLEMASSSELPGIAEPFFLKLGAEVSCTPAMNAQELAAGLASAQLR